MKAAVLALAALAAGTTVNAVQVARSGNTELRLLDSQCAHAGTLAHLKPEWRAKFKDARLMVNGNIAFFGCWILADEDTIYIQYEDGDAMEVPTKAFREVGV